MTRKWILYILIFSHSEWVAGQPLPFENNPKVSDAQGKPKSNQSLYWPYNVFPDTVWRLPLISDSTDLIWYSEIMMAAREPILSNSFLGKEIIRLTWFRAFHPKIIVRIEKSGGQVIAIQKKIRPLKQIKTGNSYRWPKYTEANLRYLVNTTEKVDSVWWNTLTKLLAESRFDQMGRNDIGGPDGAIWIIEVHSSNGWSVVAKYSPDNDRLPDFRVIGDFILDRSRFKKEERY